MNVYKVTIVKEIYVQANCEQDVLGLLDGTQKIELTEYKDLSEVGARETPPPVPYKVSPGDICVICGEPVPEGRQVCGMCEIGSKRLNRKKE